MRSVSIRSGFLFLASHPNNEPIVRGGAFVMNTEEEIEQPFLDYRKGLDRLGACFCRLAFQLGGVDGGSVSMLAARISPPYKRQRITSQAGHFYSAYLGHYHFGVTPRVCFHVTAK